MAHGDQITTREGSIRRAIDIAASTSGTLHAGVADKRIWLKRAMLNIEGAAELVLLEETTSKELGRYNVLGAQGIADILPEEGVVTETAGKGILYTLSASVGLSGWTERVEAARP